MSFLHIHQCHSLELDRKYSIPFCIPAEDESLLLNDADIIHNNSWLFYELCLMHYYNFLYSDENNNIVGTMLISDEGIKKIWFTIKKIFAKSTFFKTTVLPDNIEMYKVNVKGITEYGERVLLELKNKGKLPSIWKELYLNNLLPPSEKDGVYTVNCKTDHKYSTNSILDDLLNNKFFSAMDVTALSLQNCDGNELVERLYYAKKDIVICVDNHNGVCLKYICWNNI